MELIFHIGMGKTGTTSIQAALAGQGDALAAAGAHYLGMWFGHVAPRFDGVRGQRAFWAEPPEAMARHATTAHAAMERIARRSGARRFVQSNEAIFQQAAKVRPFFEALVAAGIDVRFLAFLRDPHDWLPSAYIQWGVRHKVQPGPIEPFALRARSLLALYDGIRDWHAAFGPRLTVHRYEADADAVADFARLTDLPLAGGGGRHLSRGDPAEVLLRALYNDRHAQALMPDRFNDVLREVAGGQVPSVDRMAMRIFDHDGIDAIVADHAETFAFIAETFGIDFRDGAAAVEPPDLLDVKERLIDYLVHALLGQADRVGQLERRVLELERAAKSD